MVSVTTTPTVTPSRSRRPARSAAALPSGSTGSRASSAAPTFEPSTPAAACTRPSLFSVISVRPLRASTRTASSSISLRRSASRSSGSCGRGHDAALALGQHLAGDDHDVVVAQPRRGGRQRGGEVVARPELGQAGHRKQFDRGWRAAVLGHGLTPARSSPARTISAVVAGSVISSGTDRTSTPAISAWSPSCTSQPSRMPTPERGAVVAADRLRRAGHADHREALVGHAAQRLSGDDGGVADHRAPGSSAARRGCRGRPGSRRC